MEHVEKQKQLNWFAADLLCFSKYLYRIITFVEQVCLEKKKCCVKTSGMCERVTVNINILHLYIQVWIHEKGPHPPKYTHPHTLVKPKLSFTLLTNVL